MLWTIIIIFIFIPTGKCQTLADAKNLYTKLFTTDGYNKEIKPLSDQSRAVEVNVSCDLVAINDFNEKAGILNVLIIFMLQWSDESLVWTPSSYNGITKLSLAEDKIWKPILVNLKEAKTFEPISNDKFRVEIAYDGTVFWTPGRLIDINCSPDISKFPFDKQNCNLDVTAWGYVSSDVVLKVTKTTMNTNYFEKNGVWNLVGTSAEAQTTGEVSTVRYGLYIERLAAYYVVNIIMPVVILTVINPLVFLLPIDCGERIGYGLTLLLSFTVFSSVVTSVLPISSSPMSVLSYTVFGSLIISACINVLNVLQFILYNKDDACPVPKCLVRMADCCCTFTCRKKQRVKDDIVQEMREDVDENIKTTTWKSLTNTLDIFFLKVFYFVITIYIIVTIVYISVGD